MKENLIADAVALTAGGMSGTGSVAERLLKNGFNTNSLRNNDVLKYDEWKQFDKAVVQAARPRLVGIGDLIRLGLVYNLGNGLGTTVLGYQDANELNDAIISMDAATRGPGERMEFTLKYLPLPIVSKDFQLSVRVLEAARRNNNPLDTSTAEGCGRKVSETLETVLFNGCNQFAFGGGVIYGYLDFPSRVTRVMAKAWDASGTTPQDIVDDVQRMKEASIGNRHYGPWILYISTNFERRMDEDYKAFGTVTLRQRILQIEGITDVKVVDKMTSSNAVLVEMNTDTVRLVQGLPMQTVQWNSGDGMLFNFKVITIMVPQLRADQNGRCGIVHMAANLQDSALIV